MEDISGYFIGSKIIGGSLKKMSKCSGTITSRNCFCIATPYIYVGERKKVVKHNFQSKYSCTSELRLDCVIYFFGSRIFSRIFLEYLQLNLFSKANASAQVSGDWVVWGTFF